MKITSDALTLSHELHHKLGIWGLKKVRQEEPGSSRLIPAPETTTKYTMLPLRDHQAISGRPPVTGSPPLHQVAHPKGVFSRVPSAWLYVRISRVAFRK